MKPKSLSIVIPAFNEEDYIQKALKEVFTSDSLGLKKEIIVIDDGSRDETAKILKKIKQNSNKNLKLILKTQNEGKGSAMKDGFARSTGDIVLIQDADLEYSPSDYPILLKPFLENNADVVYGSRLSTGSAHRVLYFWHYAVNKLLTTLSNMFTNLNLTDMETGYKVFRGDVARKIAEKLESKRFGFEPEVTARVAKIRGLKIFEVGISYSGRTYEEGKKIGWKDGLQALYLIIKYNLFG